MAQPKVTREFLYTVEVAAIIGVTPSRVTQMQSDAYPPPCSKAEVGHGMLYPLRPFGEWLRAKIIRENRLDYKAGAAEFGDAGDPREAERQRKADRDIQAARKDAALAEKAELDNAVKRGELVPAEEIIAGWQIILGRVKSRLLAIPTTATPLVVGETDQHAIRKILDEIIRDALTELSAPEENE